MEPFGESKQDLPRLSKEAVPFLPPRSPSRKYGSSMSHLLEGNPVTGGTRWGALLQLSHQLREISLGIPEGWARAKECLIENFESFPYRFLQTFW